MNDPRDALMTFMFGTDDPTDLSLISTETDQHLDHLTMKQLYDLHNATMKFALSILSRMVEKSR